MIPSFSHLVMHSLVGEGSVHARETFISNFVLNHYIEAPHGQARTRYELDHLLGAVGEFIEHKIVLFRYFLEVPFILFNFGAISKSKSGFFDITFSS